tara:strand:- start:466 stop:672 length:207 start_codon:yes stop_codon:yes gene_type:complete
MYRASGNKIIWTHETFNRSIPYDSGNRHYQEALDAIIEQGADCFDGDIPEALQAAADAKAANTIQEAD